MHNNVKRITNTNVGALVCDDRVDVYPLLNLFYNSYETRFGGVRSVEVG